MPLYEFRCDACALSFEELVFSSDPKVRCPHCKGGKVKRQLSTFAAHGAAEPASCGEGACSTASKASSGCCGGGCGCGH